MEREAALELRIAALEAAVGLCESGASPKPLDQGITVPFRPGEHSGPMQIIGTNAPLVNAMCRLLAYSVYMARGRGRENPHESIEMIEWALKTYLRDPHSLSADRMGWSDKAAS